MGSCAARRRWDTRPGPTAATQGPATPSCTPSTVGKSTQYMAAWSAMLSWARSCRQALSGPLKEITMRFLNLRPLLAIAAVLTALVMVAASVDAAPRMNMGSRGMRTNTPPPATQTAPTTAQPIERTTTMPGATATRPATPAPAQQPGGFFSRPGLLGGLAAGFLGA